MTTDTNILDRARRLGYVAVVRPSTDEHGKPAGIWTLHREGRMGSRGEVVRRALSYDRLVTFIESEETRREQTHGQRTNDRDGVIECRAWLLDADGNRVMPTVRR